MTVAPIPFTVVGGYLGAGKTTLINQLLRDPRGRRYGVVVNDIGSVNIDAALVESRQDDVVTLSNGCVCCSLADGFAAALEVLRDPARAIEHVVVEVSGVGDPWKVAQWGRTPGFVLDAVVVLADAVAIRSQAADQYVGETVLGQLASADVVVVSKADLLNGDVDGVVHWMADQTNAPILVADQAPGAILGLLRAAHTGVGDAASRAHADHVVRTIRPAPGLARARWSEWLSNAPGEVVRVKGIVPSEPNPLLVQLSGHRGEVTAWRGQPGPDAMVVVATPGVDAERLDRWIVEVQHRHE